MSTSDAVMEPIKGTGNGIMTGGKVGSKVGGLTGAAAAGVAVGIPMAIIGGAIAGIALLASAPLFALGAALTAAAITVGAAIVGGASGTLGGGALGAGGGGILGLISGIFKGHQKAKEKTPAEQLQDLRVMSAVSDGQVAQADYMLKQQEQEAAMENTKLQRAQAQQAVANPEAGGNNVAKITATAEARVATVSQR